MIDKYKYHKRVCIYCGSFRLTKVMVIDKYGIDCRNSEHVSGEIQRLANHTGYFCENCNRYHPDHNGRRIFDRKEMRRDMKKLDKLLKQKKL